jgi:hypothetical protein
MEAEDMRTISWQLALTAALITGCTNTCSNKRSSMSPEQVVEAYLDRALNMKDVSDRDKLLDYTTGNLKAAIESASAETIKAAYIDRSYQLDNYSVVERRDRTPRQTEISFQLTYLDMVPPNKDPKEAPKVTTENTVALVKESGVWLIQDVIGNKTSIDFPVSQASRITAKAGQITQLDDEQETDIMDSGSAQTPPGDAQNKP